MLGGLWMAATMRRARRPTASAAVRRLPALATVVLLLSGAAQAWWYAAGRERCYPDESPRAVAAELAPRIRGDRIGTFELAVPALDYYLRRPVRQWELSSDGTILGLFRAIASDPSPYILLTRQETPRALARFGSLMERLRAAGFIVEPIALRARFTWPAEGVPVIALSVTDSRASQGP